MKRSLSSLVGFTIIELLVVIAVIGILAAITLVSYSGVSSRATIATMQSDLSSASTALRLDQVTSSSFPASLALANNARGITSSQSLDSTIYIPDNTSNPNNFCLQYRKGTNTYAVDATTQPTKGVCLQNLVTNGDFRNGTVGWLADGGVLSAANKTLTITANGTYLNPRPRHAITYNSQPSTKLYVKFRIRVTTSSCLSLTLEATNSKYMWAFIVASPVVNQWYDASAVLTTPSDSSGNLVIYFTSSYVDVATANGKIMEVQYASVFDLTAAFGAGNEPTKATMDTIMSGYANSWFNITAKANL